MAIRSERRTERTSTITRKLWVLIHRWAGLAMAAFLILVGLTGSLLAFYPELERLVHPHWYVDRAPGSWLNAGRLVERLEAETPGLKVQSITWQDYAGATSASVSGANDPASGKPFDLDYSHVILDPATG